MQRINAGLEWVVGGISVALAVTLLAVTVILLGSTLRDFWSIQHFDLDASRPIVLGVMNALVLLELVRLFLRIEKHHVFQAPVLVDTGLVFVIREILVSLYDHSHVELLPQLAVFAAFVIAKVYLVRIRPD